MQGHRPPRLCPGRDGAPAPGSLESVSSEGLARQPTTLTQHSPSMKSPSPREALSATPKPPTSGRDVLPRPWLWREVLCARQGPPLAAGVRRGLPAKGSKGHTRSSSCLLCYYAPPHCGPGPRAVTPPAAWHRHSATTRARLRPDQTLRPPQPWAGRRTPSRREAWQTAGAHRPQTPNPIKLGWSQLSAAKPPRARGSRPLTERAWNSERSQATGHRPGQEQCSQCLQASVPAAGGGSPCAAASAR